MKEVIGEYLHASDQSPTLQQKEKKKKRHLQHIDASLHSLVEMEDTNGVNPKKKKKKSSRVEFGEATDDPTSAEDGGHKHVNGVILNHRKIGTENELPSKNGTCRYETDAKHHGKDGEKEEKREMASQDFKDKIVPAENRSKKETKLDVTSNGIIGDDGHLQVQVSGKDAQDDRFWPLQAFSKVQVPKNVLECCSGFERPSPIQAHAWPFLLEGRDLIGVAATGSGKTLAFGLPALVHVLNKSEKTLKESHATCLVLSPTRELAQQISEVLVDAGRPCGVKTACFYGGTSKKPQYAALKTGVDVIVATPGRLQDLAEEGCCRLQDVSFVVLDEADRMLDLGFEQAVRALVGQTRKSRQTIMFSATWPSAVDDLAKEFMGSNPIKVTVGSLDLAANHAVTQIIEVIDTTLRDARLCELLKKYHKSERNRVLVFVLYKKEAARVESMLQRRGWNASAVHGDKGQVDRNKAVMSFKDGTCPLLVATDVAARGLDIPDVEYVINYSFPLTTEDYVHRIGRTGRAGKSGVAHTFFTHADKARAGELVNVLKEAGQTVPSELLKFGTSIKKKESKLYGAHFKEVAVDAPKATKITFDSDED